MCGVCGVCVCGVCGVCGVCVMCVVCVVCVLCLVAEGGLCGIVVSVHVKIIIYGYRYMNINR